MSVSLTYQEDLYIEEGRLSEEIEQSETEYILIRIERNNNNDQLSVVVVINDRSMLW